MRPLAIILAFFLTFLAILFQKYYLLGYYDWDLAFFSQASWKLLHGDQFVPLVGINYFGDHSYFIHFFILPFFFFFPSPLTLLFLKLAAFCIAAYFIYKAAEDRLGPNLALCILLMYLLFPGNLFGLLYEFNPEAFAPLFIVLMFIALHKRDFRRMMFWAAFLMLIKENMILIAAAFGIRALFLAPKGERRPLIIFTVACAVIFVFFVYVLIPHFRGLEQHAFTVRYAKLGNNVREILLTPILHPLRLFKAVSLPWNVKFLGDLFSNLLIPAIFSPVALLMMLPLLLQHMCSSSLSEHTIYYHYAPTLIPFIFFALMGTLEKLKRIGRWNKLVTPLVVFLLVASIPELFTYRKALTSRWLVIKPTQAREIWKMIGEIPEDAPVIATFRFQAPLSTRAEVYSFHKLYSDDFNDPQKMSRSELNTDKGFILSERVGYALVDLDDPWYVHTIKSARESELKRIQGFFNDPRWKVLNKVDNIILLKRTMPIE